MVDSGNSLRDVHNAVLHQDITVAPSTQMVSMADGSPRRIQGDFSAAVCLDDYSEPLHFTESSLLPSRAAVSDHGPIFSLPRWVDNGWHAHFFRYAPSYIQFKDLHGQHAPHVPRGPGPAYRYHA